MTDKKEIVYTCGRLTKSCSKCKYRYKGGDRSTTCPECGESRPCKRAVKKEGDACRYHGGSKKKPAGVAHPNYKHGNYSKYLTPNSPLATTINELYEDDARLELSNELAAMRALLANTLQRLESSNTVDILNKARIYYGDLEDAQTTDDAEAWALAFLRLGEVLSSAGDIYNEYKTAIALNDAINKTVNNQRQIYKDRGEVVATAYVLKIFSTLVDALLTHVSPLQGGDAAINKVTELIYEFSGTSGANATSADERA